MVVIALTATVVGDGASCGDGGVVTTISLSGETWSMGLAPDVFIAPYGIFQFMNLGKGEQKPLLGSGALTS